MKDRKAFEELWWGPGGKPPPDEKRMTHFQLTIFAVNICAIGFLLLVTFFYPLPYGIYQLTPSGFSRSAGDSTL